MGTRPHWTYNYQIWREGSRRRRNHWWQILSRSVKGFSVCGGPKMGVSHWLELSPLQQVSSALPCCLWLQMGELLKRDQGWKWAKEVPIRHLLSFPLHSLSPPPSFPSFPFPVPIVSISCPEPSPPQSSLEVRGALWASTAGRADKRFLSWMIALLQKFSDNHVCVVVITGTATYRYGISQKRTGGMVSRRPRKSRYAIPGHFQLWTWWMTHLRSSLLSEMSVSETKWNDERKQRIDNSELCTRNRCKNFRRTTDWRITTES